ncbi:oxidoreductase [Telmatospirillum sp.]|uniref:NADH-quinone oxidoreductase subunit B family protein n=1 Tax=Telmatospirillum sp. TaxID=2079197 RepID=UPI00284BBA77|nr:oxidoreductase [Telmatospirillum sp.]MDR3440893.1 oxidoreductase [Telmatospirillum sp.]
MAPRKRPKLAVWKFSSCDGCQLSLLDCEEDLLAISEAVDISYFLEATRKPAKGPYDISLVEGSIATAHDVETIRQVRRQSRTLITIGACATAGGVQALRNFKNVKSFISRVYAHPEFIETLDQSSPISDLVAVDFELRGCPVNKAQLLEVLSATLNGRKPNVHKHAECIECKMRGNVCVTVAKGEPCLGPVVQAGCGGLCPSVGRGCFGCFGPTETPNTAALAEKFAALGLDPRDIQRQFRGLNANAEAFRKESERHGN